MSQDEMSNKIVSKEFADRVLDLTLALYRVTDIFPADEPLKKQIRAKANHILSDLIEYRYMEGDSRNVAGILAKTKSISAYLKIARARKMAKLINILVLEREYGRISDILERASLAYKSIGQDKQSSKTSGQPTKKDNIYANKSRVVRSQTPTEFIASVKDSNSRQRAIIEHLKQSNTAKISDFFAIFKGLSSKTIQRDLQDLVHKNILRREGDKRWTSYTLSNVR
jgi:predicted HTH transcriptional regulator